jgi:hypothetical protein
LQATYLYGDVRAFIPGNPTVFRYAQKTTHF